MEPVSYVTFHRDAEAEEKIKNRDVLLINNDVAHRVLTFDDCIEGLEDAFREYALGRATASRALHQVPRPSGAGWYSWASMDSAIAKLGAVSTRITSRVAVPVDGRTEGYCVTPGKFCGLIFLYSAEDGALLAILHDGHIQHVRVAVTGAISVKYMARPESATLGIFGSGGMAITHAWAITKLRPIKKIKIYSPNPDHRRTFATRLSKDLGIRAVAVDEPRQAVEGSDIVAACTNSVSPVIRGRWLETGTHVLSVSASELDDEVFRRCDRYAYSRPPSTEYHLADPGEAPGFMKNYAGKQWLEKERFVREGKKAFLADLIQGKMIGRDSESGISCFTSHGIAIQFTAMASKVYEIASQRGLGQKLPLAWFLQDIRQ